MFRSYQDFVHKYFRESRTYQGAESEESHHWLASTNDPDKQEQLEAYNKKEFEQPQFHSSPSRSFETARAY